jgi:hypothetical protein
VTELLEAALDLSSRDLAVFPVWHVFPFQEKFVCGCSKGLRCENPGKHPQARFVKNGLKDATTDPALIRHWWSCAPEANLGVATGRGRVVIDIDPRHRGDQALIELEARHGRLPNTWRARTGGGGQHLYFRSDTEVRNSVSKIATGVDVRGHGGYVVAPPSMHVSGQRYEWLTPPDALALAPLPSWLLSAMAQPQGAKAAAPVQTWRDLAKLGVDHGRRNDSVTRLAGHLLRREVDPIVTFELLSCWNATRCHPPLPENEVAGIVARIAELELRRRGAA